MEIVEKLELQGNCVIAPIYSTRNDKDAYTREDATMLEKMHKEKIKLSDAIFVVNKNNYIGSGTKREIEFAKSCGKEIIYYTDVMSKNELELICKKVVIAGSAKIPEKVNYWVDFFEKKNYKVLDYPRIIETSKFMKLYPNVHINFLNFILETDILFLMNEDKNGITGYIGYAAYAEFLVGLTQKLIYHKDIELVLLKMPGSTVGCYEEIKLWLDLGWIKLYEEENYGFKETN